MCHLCDDRDSAVQHIITTLRRSGQIKDFLVTGFILLFEAFENAQDRLLEVPFEPKLKAERERVLEMYPGGIEAAEEIIAKFKAGEDNLNEFGQLVIMWAAPEMQGALAGMYGRLPRHFPVVMEQLITNNLLIEAWLDGEDDDFTTTADEIWSRRYETLVAEISGQQIGSEHDDARLAVREIAASKSPMGGGLQVEEMSEDEKELLGKIVGGLDELVEKLGMEIPVQFAPNFEKLREELGLEPPELGDEVLSEEDAAERFNAGIDAFLEELANQQKEEGGENA